MKHFLILITTLLIAGTTWAQRCNVTSGGGPDPALKPLFDKLTKAADAVRDAKTPQSSAEAWFGLNMVADEFAEALNHLPGARADENPDKCINVALGAGAMGIPIIVCEYSNLWVAGSEGYLIYHQFYPGGPRAEDAWWYGELGNKAHNCVDYAGTKDEGEYYAPLYRDFLRHFPHGKHAADAKEMLEGFENEARMK